ncbi:ankyrin repeat domain-containing protein 40 [Spea bombifrons]|uniref:ankyrin repeat domain-containing protein 40 n=1 Tax=Spea bombifrons TaxID=233779 RepID=UPI00234AAAF4|nr:ankyrin repeat domain-containing protein 40 [Spea bombifrons]XP_053309794.1 ankyrin repeat domain-containing protein 40 [Spea bombifrons]
MEERLREAAALGDLEEVQTLLKSGASINSQNEINGWTCLHWACKRNHLPVVSFLLESGADKNILTSKGEHPAQLTSKKDIKKILGVEELEGEDVNPSSQLPFVPNYLANPPFPYAFNREASTKENNSAVSASENGSPCVTPQPAASFPLVTNGVENIHISTSSKKEDSLPALFFNGDVQIPSECTHSPVQNGPACQPAIPQGRSMFSPVPSSMPHGGFHTGPMQVFQPFFFTGAFPSNMKELVLKVRIQSTASGDNDFIEVEMDREDLTYRELLRVCCYELKICTEQVEKIRKLPNTILRKDKDVARLQDFQELELVLKSDGGLFRTSTALTERPCFNKKASQLTY